MLASCKNLFHRENKRKYIVFLINEKEQKTTSGRRENERIIVSKRDSIFQLSVSISVIFDLIEFLNSLHQK